MDEIKAELVDRVAALIDLPPERIDPHEVLVNYGLTSVQAAQLAGELEEFLGRPVEPSLVFDFPTIDALARVLAGEEGVSW